MTRLTRTRDTQRPQGHEETDKENPVRKAKDCNTIVGTIVLKLGRYSLKVCRLNTLKKFFKTTQKNVKTDES